MRFTWIFLLGLLVIPFVTQRRAPSTVFLCVLMGMIVGALFMPALVNYRPTFDLRDFAQLVWIIGGAFTGALVGMVVVWADRRFVSRG